MISIRCVYIANQHIVATRKFSKSLHWLFSSGANAILIESVEDWSSIVFMYCWPQKHSRRLVEKKWPGLPACNGIWCNIKKTQLKIWEIKLTRRYYKSIKKIKQVYTTCHLLSKSSKRLFWEGYSHHCLTSRLSQF